MKNVLEYLEQAVVKNPDKLAFSDIKTNLTFKSLYEDSRKIATYIIEKQIQNSPIVIFMEKSPNTISSFFGCIYSGNYYVPIDSEMPNSRIKLIIRSLKPKMIIVDSSTQKEALEFCDEGIVYNFEDMLKVNENTVELENIRKKSLDIDPIYIIFTSGSTGLPKGVMANHRSVIDYIENLSNILEIDEDTIFGNQAPLYVDACLKEIYPTLKFCATTYFVPKAYFMFPVKLVEFLNEYKINTICWVVSALTIISGFGTFKNNKIEHLRTIAFGSELFPIKQFNMWRQHLPKAKFINLYGPTEATGMSTYFKVERDFMENEVIPIGQAFDNTQILLINEENKLAKENEIGEICIRGTCLTIGYYDDEEKNKEAYIQNPLNNKYPDLIYKTGDLGKFNELRRTYIYIKKRPSN